MADAEIMSVDPNQPVHEDDARRHRLLQNLAKAREARKAKLAQGHRAADPPVLGENEEIVDPPKRKYQRKYKGRRALNAALAEKKRKAKEPTDLAGIRPGPNGGCPVACNIDRCVITGENVCGHPHKGGLQAKYLQMKDVLRRFGDARLALAAIEVEERRR